MDNRKLEARLVENGKGIGERGEETKKKGIKGIKMIKLEYMHVPIPENGHY